MAGRPHGAINSSALHVFEVLRLIAETEEPLGVSEISRRLGLPASTVYRALITLEDSDYLVRYQNTPRYELGLMPHLLNRALVHRFRLHASSRHTLRALAEQTGETVSLTVRLGWYGLRLAGVYGSRDIYHRDRLGEVGLLHLSLQGLGILGFLGDVEFAAYCRFVEKHHADAASGAWSGVARERDHARRTGFVHKILSAGDSLAAVAVPVRDPSDAVIASLAVSGPVYLPGGETADAEWQRARAELEAEIAAAPEAFVSPFAHVPADEIVVRPQPRAA